MKGSRLIYWSAYFIHNFDYSFKSYAIKSTFFDPFQIWKYHRVGIWFKIRDAKFERIWLWNGWEKDVEIKLMQFESYYFKSNFKGWIHSCSPIHFHVCWIELQNILNIALFWNTLGRVNINSCIIKVYSYIRLCILFAS